MDDLTPEMLESVEVETDNQAFTEQPLDDSSALEEGSVEKTPTQEVSEEIQQKETFYTSEEIAELLKSDKEVDTSRLSDEGKLLMKSFQKGLTSKMQALAEDRKKIEEARQRMETENIQKNNPREFLYRQFLNNPQGVVRDINSEIDRLEADDPYNEENRKQLSQLRWMKDEFILRKDNESTLTRHQEITIAKANTEILSAIPDFQAKAPQLVEFGKQYGLTEKTIQVLSDPTIVGGVAVEVIKALNNMHTALSAGKTAEKKLNKQAPPKLGRAGSGDVKSKIDPSNLSMKEFEEWWDKTISKGV